MSEAAILERPDEQQFDEVLQQPELHDITPNLTEDMAAAQLAAEAHRPDYLKPDESRELISTQDKQDYETYVSYRYLRARDQVDEAAWHEAKDRLYGSDNIYTQMLVFCEDLDVTMMGATDEARQKIDKDTPLLHLNVDDIEIPELVAKEFADVQQAAQQFIDELGANLADDTRPIRRNDPELVLEAAKSRLLCSMADQLSVKTVSEGRFVSDVIRTTPAENLPDFLEVLDRSLRQEPPMSVNTARVLGQIDIAIANVEEENYDNALTRNFSPNVHAVQKNLDTFKHWHAYESARTMITPEEQNIASRGYSLTEEEFQRIHDHAYLFEKWMNLEPKDLLKYIIDKPEVMEIIERFDANIAPRVVDLLDGIHMQASVQSSGLSGESTADEQAEWDSLSREERLARRDQRLDERYTACVADAMAELEKIAAEPNAIMIVQNLNALVPGNENKVFGDLQPETVGIMLKKYPALVRLEAFPEIAQDLFSAADMYERIADVSGAHEVTGEVFADLLTKVERIAAIKPELLEAMTHNPLDKTTAYNGLATRLSTMFVSANDPGTYKALWLSDVGLEKLLVMAKDVHGEELRYLFAAVAALTPKERDLRKLYSGGPSEKKLDELYDFGFSGENLKTLLTMYNRAKIHPKKFHYFKQLSLETQTVEYITNNSKVRDVLTKQLDPKVLEDVISRLEKAGHLFVGSQTTYVEAVVQSFEDLGENANQEVFMSYYAVLRGDLEAARRRSGLQITKEGQAGIDQLKAQLSKFRDEVLSGTVDIDKLESSPVCLAYFKSLVRYESSEWGRHDDGSLMMLFKEVEYARSEGRTGLIDAEAYQPSEEMTIAKVDQAALDAFEITKDSQALWRELTEDIRAANAIVFIDQPQLLEGVIGEIDEKVQKHIERLEGGREKLEHRLTQVPAEKQPKLQASIEAVNVQIAELRDTTQGELMQTSKIIRHLRVLSQYDDMKSPLRKALFTTTLMKYPNEQARVARLLGTPSDKVKLTDLEHMSEFVQHMTNQETWGPIVEAFEMQKGFNRILEIGAINEDISRGKNIGSSGARSLQFIPTRDALMELSGHIGDACWANRYHSIASQFPNFTSVIMVQKPGTKDARLAGSAFLVEARDKRGEPVLVIRGLNPIQNVIEQLDEEDFFKNFSNYAREIADQRGMKLAVVIDGHSGGSATNRPKLFRHLSEQLKPQLQPIELANEPVTEFNGYNISGHTYLL